MIGPSTTGLMPMPLSRIARSTFEIMPLSQTLMTTIRGSGTLIVPSWFSGVCWP